jgi:hypothetical protein
MRAKAWSVTPGEAFDRGLHFSKGPIASDKRQATQFLSRDLHKFEFLLHKINAGRPAEDARDCTPQATHIFDVAAAPHPGG